MLKFCQDSSNPRLTPLSLRVVKVPLLLFCWAEMLLTGSLALLVAFIFPYKLFILSARKLHFGFVTSGIKR